MTTVAIRQQLHSYLEIADDSKVKFFYMLMKQDIDESGVVYRWYLKRSLNAAGCLVEAVDVAPMAADNDFGSGYRGVTGCRKGKLSV
jgi:hypothetical protein